VCSLILHDIRSQAKPLLIHIVTYVASPTEVSLNADLGGVKLSTDCKIGADNMAVCISEGDAENGSSTVTVPYGPGFAVQYTGPAAGDSAGAATPTSTTEKATNTDVAGNTSKTNVITNTGTNAASAVTGAPSAPISAKQSGAAPSSSVTGGATTIASSGIAVIGFSVAIVLVTLF
jgi:hypothetical protein